MSDFIYPNFLGDELRLPYYPVGIGIYHNQEPVVRPWGYHQYQWIQCRSGSGELYIGEKRYVRVIVNILNEFLFYHLHYIPINIKTTYNKSNCIFLLFCIENCLF